jgi:predicted nucleotidyltransferase
MISERLNPNEKQAIVQLLSPFHPDFIYLFGSYGSPSQHPSSDIDIAFLTSLPTDPVQIFKIANLLADRLHHHVDLIDLTLASTVFRKEVIRTGVPIFIGNESAQQNFEMYTLSDYARLNEERHEIISA